MKKGILTFPIKLQISTVIKDGQEKKNKQLVKDTYGWPGSLQDLAERPELVHKRLERFRSNPNEYTHIAIDTSNVYQIDIDCPQYSEDIKNFLNEYPFTRSSTKAYGRHIFVKDPDSEPRCKRLQFKKELGNAVELLCGQWAWCPKNEYVNNSNAAFYYSGLDTLIAPGKESVNKPTWSAAAHGKEGDLNSENPQRH